LDCLFTMFGTAFHCVLIVSLVDLLYLVRFSGRKDRTSQEQQGEMPGADGSNQDEPGAAGNSQERKSHDAWRGQERPGEARRSQK
jgi:hypothetical protein